MFAVLASLRGVTEIMFIKKETLKTIRMSKGLQRKFKIFRILGLGLIRIRKGFRVKSNKEFIKLLIRLKSPKRKS
jgi:hypothetical protein